MASHNKNKKKVFIGLSGGVDSALSAQLLLEQGYDVIGVFIETWHPDFLPCTWKDDRREAMRVAAHLAIPFVSLDLSEKYRKEVGEYFIDEYRKGRTPNPDVMCNRSIKFGGFADYARARGADYIATGHYAQIEKVGEAHYLKKGIDASKDQSYFLWMLTSQDLAFALFPVGSMTKERVRAEAKRRGLPQATRKDSQGICFLGAIDLPEFLSHFFPIESGAVLNASGKAVGIHKGASLYTQGERHGFEITDTKTRARPQYVLKTDIKTNTVVVGDQESVPQFKKLTLRSARIEKEALLGTCEGVLRYHGKQSNCKVTETGGVFEVEFDSPISVALGQSLVLYKGDRVVGGGVIEAGI